VSPGDEQRGIPMAFLQTRRHEHRQIVRADSQQLAKSSFGDPLRLELQSHLAVERLEDDGS